MAWAQCDTAQVARDGVMGKLLQMIGQVCQGVVHLTAQQELAVIQLAETHLPYEGITYRRFLPA